MVGVAQGLEHQAVDLGVEGSKPFTHPNNMLIIKIIYQHS